MKERTKIILMYVGIVVFAAALISTFAWLRAAQEAQEKIVMNERIAKDAGRARSAQMFQVEGDLEATNQDGEVVRISDLEDKVFLIAEFFAACPMCAARNGDHLVNFYEKYKNNPDFHVVCVSVDPETDDVERLKSYAENLGAETEDWWFLTGPQERLHTFMEREMKFLPVAERTDPILIKAEGRYAHDMGIAVVGKGLKVLEKKDLFFAKEQSEDLYTHFESLIDDAIQRGLRGEEDVQPADQSLASE